MKVFDDFDLRLKSPKKLIVEILGFWGIQKRHKYF